MKRFLPTLIILLFAVVCYGQTSKTKLIYWSSDKEKCPICDSVTIEGDRYHIFKTPEIELAFSGNKNEKLMWASVYLLNTSNTRIELDPSKSVLITFVKRTDKTPIETFPLTPEDAAKKMKGNQGFKNFLTSLSAGMARRTSTVESNSSGTIMDNQGNSAIVTGQTSGTVSSPDYAAQERAERQIAERNAKAANRENAFLSTSLLANTIFPNKEVLGNIYFKKTKGETGYIGVLVNDSLYLVPFSMN